MHVEKNVFDNIVNTLLDVDNKSKDNLNARRDLEDMEIRSGLHPRGTTAKPDLPNALYYMTPRQKKMFCKVMKDVKFPDGYASNLHNKVSVDGKKLVNLKTHDCHIIMHDLLPLAIRHILPEIVCVPLIRLSNYFKQVCSKVVDVKDMERLEAEIPETLCLLEKIFPPAFFDIMVHLTMHLATEVRLAGPIHYRSMWVIERFIGKLKSMVHTRSHPEGSITEGYMFDETLTFCSRYLQGCQTRLNRLGRRYKGIAPSTSHNQQPYLSKEGHPLSGFSVIELDNISWVQAQRYVLVNYPYITSYVQKHKNILSVDKRRTKRDVECAHHSSFHTWFSEHVESLIAQGVEVTQELKLLACLPYRMVRKYHSYYINGCTFHAMNYGEDKSTQCYGVAVVARTSSFSSAKDKNPSSGDVDYYGRIREIVELDYSNLGHVVLFRCDWVDSAHHGHGVRKDDEFGIVEVNFNHLLNNGSEIFNEPFILASQATQVYYVQNSIEKDWYAVVCPPTRDFYDMEPRIDRENES